jgi:hypothetical protein
MTDTGYDPNHVPVVTDYLPPLGRRCWYQVNYGHCDVCDDARAEAKTDYMKRAIK